jgi:hypothetical protein
LCTTAAILAIGSADPFIRALAPSELTVNASKRRWSEIRSRLQLDADAEISDLT